MTDIEKDKLAAPVMTSKPKQNTGFNRFLPALKYSFAGIAATLRSESAFRQEICAFIMLFPLALWLGETNVERVLLIAPLFVVLIVELLNSAIESVVDRWGLEYHELAKLAKDAGSAAVFLSLMLTLFTWVMLILIP